MERFVHELTLYARRLNEGEAFGGVTLCHSPPASNLDGGVLRCDGRLLRHWRNFAEALRSFDERCARLPPSEGEALGREEGWWLSRIELGEDLRDLLRPVLAARTRLRTLILDWNGCGRDGVAFVCSVVERNPHLRRLSLHNNPMEDLGGAYRFCEAVRGHPSLEHLTLENVGLGDDEDRLATILDAGRNLQCLGLANNGIGSPGAAAVIATFLAADDTDVKIAYLRDNRFGDESAPLFAAALRGNGRLRALDLGGNRFSPRGGRTVRDALFDASSLEAAMESNHRCVAYVDEAQLRDRLGVINCRGTPGENRRRKVFSTLYATADRGRLGCLLDGVPMGLMPKLLACLQEFRPGDVPRGMRKHAMETLQQYTLDDFEEAFGRQSPSAMVFEVCRSWNLPSLYANL